MENGQFGRRSPGHIRRTLKLLVYTRRRDFATLGNMSALSVGPLRPLRWVDARKGSNAESADASQKAQRGPF